MAEELADTHAAEQPDVEVSSGAEIPQKAPEKASDKPITIREALTASIKEVGEKEQRARDIASGKFIPKDKAPDKVEAKESKDPPGASSAELRPASETKPAGGPPPGWSQASKDYFNSLPPDHPIRQDVAKREAEVANGFQRYSEKNKLYDELDRVLAPSRAVYQQFGAKNDVEAVSRLIEWESALRSDPRGGIHRLAQQLGVDLSQIAQSQDSTVDPGLQQTLRPVLDEFGQLKSQLNSMMTAQQQAQQEKIASELSTFAKDKPHFERVRVRMGQLMQGGVVAPNDLESAYQQAIWSDPELRDQLLREEDEKRKAEFAKTQAEQAKNARLAAISPGVRAPSTPPKKDDKSSKGVRADLLRSISELRDRA
jgi:hypothetical protein